MPLDTPPQLRMARSASTHSITVLAWIDAVSPRFKPRCIRPPAISRTASPVWAQVQLRQMPSCFWRIQTLGARCATAFQNIAGMVSPSSTMRVSGWMWDRSQRLVIGPHACHFVANVHRQFFFFFQRRSPRTPASFMPR